MVIDIKELEQSKFAGVSVFGENPEELAWEKMRYWAKANIQDYKKRQYFGCAPNGQNGKYEYIAQVVLKNDEVINEQQTDVRLYNSPNGLFVVGDVDYTSTDMGTALENSYFQMVEWLKKKKEYVIQMDDRPVLEEHIFNDKWTSGIEGISGFKLWLPIRKEIEK